MRFWRNSHRFFGVSFGIVVAGALTVSPTLAQTSSVIQQPPAMAPPLPVARAPIDYFRELLALSANDRERLLADKSAEQRKVLLAKLSEYEKMDSEERELRLKVTELRWYLMPLMKKPPAARAEWLGNIPEEKRALVEERLQLWDELSPIQQKEFWENEMAINYFLRLQSSTPEQQTNLLQSVSPQTRERLEKELARWRTLPVEDRDRMCNRFQQFFDMNPREKEKTLDMLSEAERVQMEKTLQTFQNLAPAQRKHCIESFRKFARMDPAERNQFLRKAEMWQKMSPEDRSAWRELVQKLPQMPPLPPGLKVLPPMPPTSRMMTPPVATNPAR